jgi:hypothetical protein
MVSRYQFQGPVLTINGRQWEGQNTENVSFNGSSFENQNVPLQPAPDEPLARMIRSSIWNSGGSNFIVRDVPNGTYQVYLYVWEDNAPVNFDVRLQDKLVQQTCTAATPASGNVSAHGLQRN